MYLFCSNSLPNIVTTDPTTFAINVSWLICQVYYACQLQQMHANFSPSATSTPTSTGFILVEPTFGMNFFSGHVWTFFVVVKEGEKGKRQENGVDKLIASEPGHNMIGKTAPKICEFSGERRESRPCGAGGRGPGFCPSGPGLSARFVARGH